MDYNNQNFNDDDVTNSQWQGSTWTDSSYSSSSGNYNKDSYDAYTNNIDITKINFEENVLSQSFVFMAVALLITALTAFYVASSPRLIVNIIYNSSLFYGLLISEFVVVFAANFAVRKNNIVLSAILFTLYSVINGATLSIILIMYTSASIAGAFLSTALMFGVMAVYGITTKKDLSSIGNLCMMGLTGIIIADFLNIIILKSSMADTLISIVGIVIFTGLTAYDTQKIKRMVRYTNSENITCLALMGALELYLDFINIFLKLLSLTGKRRK